MWQLTMGSWGLEMIQGTDLVVAVLESGIKEGSLFILSMHFI